MFKSFTTLAISGVFLASSMFAAGRIAQRRKNQQDRIAQGVKSGQLTAEETARLETKEAAVNKEVRAERTLNGGKLTPAEKRQVNRQQNQLGRNIYAQKHDAQKQ